MVSLRLLKFIVMDYSQEGYHAIDLGWLKTQVCSCWLWCQWCYCSWNLGLGFRRWWRCWWRFDSNNQEALVEPRISSMGKFHSEFGLAPSEDSSLTKLLYSLHHQMALSTQIFLIDSWQLVQGMHRSKSGFLVIESWYII